MRKWILTIFAAACAVKTGAARESVRSPEIVRMGEMVQLSWNEHEGWPATLYSSRDLREWTAVHLPSEFANGRRTVAIPSAADREFYRLERPSIPSARLEPLERTGWTGQQVRDGLVFYERHFESMFGDPQVVQVLALALDHPGLRLELTATDVWGWTRLPVPEFAERSGAIAAINGGFAPGRRFPEVGYGMMKFRGEVWPFVNDPEFNETWEAHGRNAVGIDADGGWHFRSRGDQGWETGAIWPDDWEEMTDVMAGGSHLVRDGEIHPLVVPETARGAYVENDILHRLTFRRHPRTAIGITENRVAVLVNIAGRFPGKAAGMTLQELAHFMRFAGCRDALELDGGGSTTMWIRDEPFGGVVNYPTGNQAFDHEGARTLRLAVLIFEETGDSGE